MRLDLEPSGGLERTGLVALLTVGLLAAVVLRLQRPPAPAQVLWVRVCGDAVRVAPAIDGDRLLAASEDGWLEVFQLADGRTRWRAELGDPAVAPPVVQDGLVFVATGAHLLLALDRDTGQPIWRQQLSAPLEAGLAVVDSVLLCAGSDGRLRGLEARTGARLWSARLTARPTGGPVGAGGVAMVPLADGSVGAYLADGRLAWLTRVSQLPVRLPAVAAGRLLVLADDGLLTELDPATGRGLRHARLGRSAACPATPVEDRVAVADAAGWLRLLAPAGRASWSARLPEPATSGPVAVGHRLVVADRGRALRVFDAASGRQVWQLRLPADITAPMTTDGTRLALGTSGGEVAVLLFH